MYSFSFAKGDTTIYNTELKVVNIQLHGMGRFLAVSWWGSVKKPSVKLLQN